MLAPRRQVVWCWDKERLVRIQAWKRGPNFAVEPDWAPDGPERLVLEIAKGSRWRRSRTRPSYDLLKRVLLKMHDDWKVIGYRVSSWARSEAAE